MRRGENRGESLSPVWVGGEGDAEYRWQVHLGGGRTLSGPVSSMWTGVAVFLQVRAQKYLDAGSPVCGWTPKDALIPSLWLGPGIGIGMSSPGD